MNIKQLYLNPFVDIFSCFSKLYIYIYIYTHTYIYNFLRNKVAMVNEYLKEFIIYKQEWKSQVIMFSFIKQYQFVLQNCPVVYKKQSFGVLGFLRLCSYKRYNISSVQFSCSVVSDILRPQGLQHARVPCPSPTQWTVWKGYNMNQA